MLTLAGKALPVPILQGGMGVGVSLGGLAGAVAACGGMGCISTADAGYREPDFARDPAAANHRALTAEIQKAKALAKGAGLVAINAMVATQDYAAAIRTAVEAGVDAVVSGAGLPLELPGLVGTQEVAIAPIVSSARAAKLILRRWAKEFARTADFVVIEGCKAGGHLGFAEADLLADHCQSLDEILPEVLAEVQPYEAQFGHAIPVFVAGGIYTGADMAHYTKLGAAGVQLATRFIPTYECDAAAAPVCLPLSGGILHGADYLLWAGLHLNLHLSSWPGAKVQTGGLTMVQILLYYVTVGICYFKKAIFSVPKRMYGALLLWCSLLGLTFFFYITRPEWVVYCPDLGPDQGAVLVTGEHKILYYKGGSIPSHTSDWDWK